MTCSGVIGAGVTCSGVLGAAVLDAGVFGSRLIGVGRDDPGGFGADAAEGRSAVPAASEPDAVDGVAAGPAVVTHFSSSRRLQDWIDQNWRIVGIGSIQGWS
jgi:hypothetical protein